MSALAEALIAAQAELPTALGKDAANEAAGYRYLTLDKLIAATRPILNKHGLLIYQSPTMLMRGENGAVPTLTTTIVCKDDEDVRIEFTTPLYLQEKNMQALGSAITYARRYAWAAALGIAAEEDTDAAPIPEEDIPF